MTEWWEYGWYGIDMDLDMDLDMEGEMNEGGECGSVG